MQNLKLILFLSISLLANNLFADGCERLVWADEFDYDGAPDSKKWGYDIGGDGWGNEEIQYYTNNRKNSFVKDGYLTIRAIKENVGGRNYSSARLVSREKGDWKYGRFEIRAKLPSGKGTWPAIWMLPTDWEYGGWPESGEIDIMEHVGYDLNVIHGTVHTEDYNHQKNTQKGGSKTVSGATENFHIYAIDWQENRIDFLIDGEKYFTFYKESDSYKEWPFDKRFHLLLNIAIGGTWGGLEGVDDNIFPTEMLIDYVRVYQSFDQVNIDGPSVVVENQQNIEFSCTNISNVDFEWTVPEGAQIINGQGTNTVTVNWGTIDGDVTVKIISNDDCNELAGEWPVYVSADGVKSFLIYDFEGNGFAELIDNENVDLSIDNGVGRLKPDIEGRRMVFELNEPTNILNMSMLKVDFHGQGVNKQFGIMFIVDTDGNQSKINQLKLESFGQHNLLHAAIDFRAAANEVDLTRIEKIVLRIDEVNTPLAVDKLAFYSTEDIPGVPQNPRIIKKGEKYLLWWEDSPAALNYDVLFGPEEDGEFYSMQSNILGNEIPVRVEFTSVKKYFRVVAKNESGISDKSKAVNDQSVGENETRAKDHYSIEGNYLKLFDENAQLFLYDLNGKLIEVFVSERLINLEQYRGIYIIQIKQANEVLTDKIKLF
ncbi:MAG: family 16 glycosylhydrolase [Bacteroidia bacterium]